MKTHNRAVHKQYKYYEYVKSRKYTKWEVMFRYFKPMHEAGIKFLGHEKMFKGMDAREFKHAFMYQEENIDNLYHEYKKYYIDNNGKNEL